MFGGLQLCFSKERWLCVRTDGFYWQRAENTCGPCKNLYYNGNDSWKCTTTKSYEIFEDCRSSWAELEKYFDEEEFANRQKQNEEKEIEAKQEMDEELKKIDAVTGQKIEMVANKLQAYDKGELLMLLKEPGVSPDLTIQKLAANPEKIQAQEKDDEDDDPEPYQAVAVDKEELLMLLKEPGVSPDLTIQKLVAILEKIQAYERQVKQTKAVARDEPLLRENYQELVKRRKDWEVKKPLKRRAVQGEIREIETVKDEDEAAKGMELKAREEL